MSRHRLLARQLKRQLGLSSPEQAQALFSRLEAIAAQEGGDVGNSLRGLRGFIDQIDQSYALYDRDVALSSRSLEISSKELLDANAHIRAKVEAQQRVLGPLRDAFRQLATQAGLPDITGDELGLETLLQRMSSLITAHDAAKRQLRASEASFRARASLSPEWYWEQDTELRFVDTSGRSDERGGLTPKEHLGARRWELPNTEPVHTTWDAHRAALDARETFHDLLLRRTPARGGLHYVEVSGMPMYDANGRFSGYHGIARDVTERVNADATLREAKQAADAASAAKSRFLANMSHEIRTPMNGLLGMAELMLDEPMAASQRERVQLMLSSGRSLLAIINDILDFSKIEAGRQELDRIEFDLRPTIDQLVDLYGVQAKSKGLPLRVEFDAAMATALIGDPGRLKQVLGNLLSNAVKFTANGSIALRVACGAVVEEADTRHVTVHIEVEDTGPGIAPEVAAGLFQPFTQADAATTRRFGGTGLGLAISKHLAELIGGRIGLRSEPGSGSLFWIDLPFELSVTQPAASNAAKIDTLEWAGRRALLVEDNDVNAIVAQTQLERLGLHVDVAADGALALAALDSQCYDIVLMDCQMPHMDGFEAVRRWRTIERERGPSGATRTPVIALTANAMVGDRERSLDAGFDDHLGKPFSRDDLRCALARLVGPVDAPGEPPEGSRHSRPAQVAHGHIVAFEAPRPRRRASRASAPRRG